MYSHCQCGAATSLQNTVCWVTQDRMSNQSLLQAGLSLRFETAIAFRQVHSGTPSDHSHGVVQTCKSINYRFAHFISIYM